MQIADVPVFILCGGKGTRMGEETTARPKPMIEIGGRPILVHLIRKYARHGFRRFILCVGYRAEVIVDYLSRLKHDDEMPECKIYLAHTGEDAMTGARVARAAARYLGSAEHFAVTYGDGLTDANLADEFTAHLASRHIGTVLGVHPPERFGELIIVGSDVIEFTEKPTFSNRWVNGGFFFFRRVFAARLSTDDACVLEGDPLTLLAMEGNLRVHRHSGFWACMDTPRDREALEALWQTGKAPWL